MWQFEFEFTSETSQIIWQLFRYYSIDPLSTSRAFFFVNSKEIIVSHVLHRAASINVFKNPHYKDGLLISLWDLSFKEYINLYMECGTRGLYPYTIFLPDNDELDSIDFLNKINTLSKKDMLSFADACLAHEPILNIFPEILLLVSSRDDGMNLKISGSLETTHPIFDWSVAMLTKSASLDEKTRNDIWKKRESYAIPQVLYSSFKIIVNK